MIKKWKERERKHKREFFFKSFLISIPFFPHWALFPVINEQKKKEGSHKDHNTTRPEGQKRRRARKARGF